MDRLLDELLHALMQNMTLTVSGEKLARDLGVSHSTLARWVDKLREAGMEIRGELFTGYRLVRLPDVLLPQLIRPRLRTTIVGRSLYHFYSVDSTNAFANRLLAHGRKVQEGTVIIAESQTAGRGRLGRSWHSEREAGVYFSLVLFPKAPPSLAPLFTLGTAVAMHNAIERYTGMDIDIKWPTCKKRGLIWGRRTGTQVQAAPSAFGGAGGLNRHAGTPSPRLSRGPERLGPRRPHLARRRRLCRG